MKQIRYYIFLIVALLMGFSACIQDDLTSCPQYIRLLLTAENNIPTIHSADLKTATFFIFDKEDLLVDTVTWNEPELNQVYRPEIILFPDDYQVIAWVNLLTPCSMTPALESLVIGETRKQDLQMQVALQDTFPLLLYGHITQTVQVPGDNFFTIPLVPDRNILHFSVSGIAQSDHRYRFEITDDNNRYTFDNDFAPGDKVSYRSDTVFTAEQISTTLFVLKLAANRLQPQLKITDLATSKVIFPDRESTSPSLIRLIQTAYPNNDFNIRHEYWIDIVFIGPEVWVNGWQYKQSDNEIYPD